MLNEAYCSLNKSFKREAVFWVGYDAGFFSEYNNMILAMLYCLDNQIQFRICAGPTNFHLQNGWNGFFLPFCDQAKNNGAHYRDQFFWKRQIKCLFKFRNLSGLKNFIPAKWRYRSVLLTQDLFPFCRSIEIMDKHYNIPELGIDGDLQDACSKLIEITWRYNDSTSKKIKEYLQSIDLPSRYIGFHIRGGDKYIEHPLESIDAYFRKVNDHSIKDAFVLTDDYSIIEEIEHNYPDWNIFTLCDKSERGYYFKQFLSQDEERIHQQYIKLFASIDILANSVQFIGTFSSNPGMYLGMRNRRICTGVDFDNWVLW